MAQITFLSGPSNSIPIGGGSGLGFYGANFGASVNVGSYQGTTFITNPGGTAQGPSAGNVKFLNAQSGIVGAASSGINLLAMTNIESTLAIEFFHDTQVKTQNVKAYIYDRLDTARPASGVTTKVAEIIHLNPAQGPGGSGDNLWHTFSGSIVDASHYIDLCPAPGSGGRSANGAGTSADFVHHNYLAISSSPDSIGSKTYYGIFVSLEYL